MYVSNSVGLSSSASVTVSILFEDVPSVSIGNIKAKYNHDVGDTILINGTIASEVGSGKAFWSGDASLSLNAIKLTDSLTRSTLIGLNSFSLGLTSKLCVHIISVI